MGGGGVGRPYGASLGEDVGFAVTRGWGVCVGLLPGSASVEANLQPFNKNFPSAGSVPGPGD